MLTVRFCYPAPGPRIIMNNVFRCVFPNVGFIGCDLTDDEFDPILDDVNRIQNNFEKSEKMNSELVGHIEREYKIVNTFDHIESIVAPMCQVHDSTFTNQSQKIKNYKLLETWVNFQKKHEFNPLHYHKGDFSFVIYVKIPYTIEEENKLTPLVPDQARLSGCFNFYYTDALGTISQWTIPTDRNYEKKLIVFPAKMNHSVMPFYSSDGYRISISGNLEVIK